MTASKSSPQFPEPITVTGDYSMKNQILVAAVATLVAGSAAAIDLGDDSLKLTGFYNLTAAKVLSGKALVSSAPWSYNQFNCPCTIQN